MFSDDFLQIFIERKSEIESRVTFCRSECRRTRICLCLFFFLLLSCFISFTLWFVFQNYLLKEKKMFFFAFRFLVTLQKPPRRFVLTVLLVRILGMQSDHVLLKSKLFFFRSFKPPVTFLFHWEKLEKACYLVAPCFNKEFILIEL